MPKSNQTWYATLSEGFRRGGVNAVPTEGTFTEEAGGFLLILTQFLILSLELRVLVKKMFITTSVFIELIGIILN